MPGRRGAPQDDLQIVWYADCWGASGLSLAGHTSARRDCVLGRRKTSSLLNVEVRKEVDQYVLVITFIS